MGTQQEQIIDSEPRDVTLKTIHTRRVYHNKIGNTTNTKTATKSYRLDRETADTYRDKHKDHTATRV